MTDYPSPPATQLDISRIIDELKSYFNNVSTRLDGINTRLDLVNTQVHMHEVDLALLKRDAVRLSVQEHDDKTEGRLRELVKEYITPAGVVGLIVYNIGKSMHWWP